MQTKWPRMAPHMVNKHTADAFGKHDAKISVIKLMEMTQLHLLITKLLSRARHSQTFSQKYIYKLQFTVLL